MKLSVLSIICACAATYVAAYPLSVKSVPLAAFDGSSSLQWQAVNDPVMGGQSVGNFSIDKQRSVAVWQGEVKIVPFLHAPGFCNAQAPPMGQTADFPSAMGTEGISIRVRTVGKSLSHYSMQLMTKGAHHWFKQGVYNANITFSADWQDVFVPWSAFVCTWRGEHIDWCPELSSQLAEITNVGVGTAFPGQAGSFHVEIASISAVSSPSPSGTGCKSTEYCCPDAKRCLTPTMKSCKLDAKACAAGEVCCPLTKICVMPGKPCTSPCADSGTYCCPDAKKCLTPTNPGTFCKAATDCKSDEVCCPLTKLCVAPGKDCKA